jgi:hypothetical protein
MTSSRARLQLWKVFQEEEQKMKRQKLARLQNLAASLNYQLVPNQ